MAELRLQLFSFSALPTSIEWACHQEPNRGMEQVE